MNKLYSSKRQNILGITICFRHIRNIYRIHDFFFCNSNVDNSFSVSSSSTKPVVAGSGENKLFDT